MTTIRVHRYQQAKVDKNLEVCHREAYLRLREGSKVSPDEVIIVVSRLYQILIDGNATTHRGKLRALKVANLIETDSNVGSPLRDKIKQMKQKECKTQ